MNFYDQSVDDVLGSLNSSSGGLSSADAEQRQHEYGLNKLDEAKKTPMIVRFFQQMADPMIIILLVAAVISGVTSIYSGEGLADVFIILIVVLVNALLGVIQESKAEKAIEALQKMSAATTRVLRDGRVQPVPSAQLVPGDVILLEAGDAVPADGRIIENASLKIEEAALTGESVPVNKSLDLLMMQNNAAVPLGDRKNMCYMGSTVVYGRGKAVLTGTGMHTEMGKIATALTQTSEGQTPLQKKLGQLSKILTWLVLGICVFIFGFSLLRADAVTGPVVLNTFMIAVSLAVAAIPEGLVTVVTIVLSIGVTNMSKRNSIIRRMTAVETLGCAQVICSDKTGTLTQNKMTVVEQYGADVPLLATALALCSDSTLNADNVAEGEPTENALVNFAFTEQLPKPALEARTPRVGEAPFDSMRKMMSTLHQADGVVIQYTKGAPDEVLKVCTRVLTKDGVVEISDDLRQNILAQNKQMADRALRVLAGATTSYPRLPAGQEPQDLEKNLTFLGLVGMIDPVRPEVSAAIVECREAGIKPVMITGDHIDTAVAIATQLGIISNATQAITGATLDGISEEDFHKSIQNYGVYARVQPEHKVRIVNTWRDLGYVTAMTGDGVNDAPSIKSADIGIGMGITGTDVTKNVADMVLADDNFATIVGAVEEGRRIYDNIRKAIQFLLSSNMSEVLAIFFATLLGFVILEPIHLLWINLVTDCLPAIALGFERAEPSIMQRKPRPSSDGIFAGGMGVDIAIQGALVTILTVASYFIGHFIESGVWEIANSPDGMTMAFVTLSMAEIFHSFNMRSQRGSIFKLGSQNKLLWGAGVLSLALTSALLYIPFLREAFSLEFVSANEFLISLALAALMIPAVELIKLIQRAVTRRRSA